MNFPWFSLLKILGMVVLSYFVILFFIRAEVKLFGSEKIRKAFLPQNNGVKLISRRSEFFWAVLILIVTIAGTVVFKQCHKKEELPQYPDVQLISDPDPTSE